MIFDSYVFLTLDKFIQIELCHSGPCALSVVYNINMYQYGISVVKFV